jgi:hypothetical protein
MSARFAKLMAAICLLLAAWGLTLLRQSESYVWAPSAGNPRPARILRFYASVGTVLPGQKAMLCYGVENAKSVRISPWMTGVTPSPKRCLEVFPDHTTHYTILAEGYDGVVVTRSLTLPVAAEPPAPEPIIDFAFSPAAGPRLASCGGHVQPQQLGHHDPEPPMIESTSLG